jgi:hypothetical protein
VVVGDVVGPDEAGEEAADLGDGERDQLAGLFSGPLFLAGRGAGGGEEGVGEHREGDVAVPAVPAADLVLVQADFSFGGLEGLLDRPAGAGDPHQLAQRVSPRACYAPECQTATG